MVGGIVPGRHKRVGHDKEAPFGVTGVVNRAKPVLKDTQCIIGTKVNLIHLKHNAS